MKAAAVACLITSVLGIALVFAMPSGYEQRSVAEIRAHCSGTFMTEASVKSVFYSKKGNRIGSIPGDPDVLVLLNGYALRPRARAAITGKASMYNGACWLFPDKVTPLD